MKLVFTNGVFDILHSGHIRLLQYARSLGDHLIVAINSDESATRLKRYPVQDQFSRQMILQELRCVDEVVIFYQDTPEYLIQQIRPNVLIKGPDCLNKVVPGAEFIQSIGGEIIIPDWLKDQSTTQIIEKIRRGYGGRTFVSTTDTIQS